MSWENPPELSAEERATQELKETYESVPPEKAVMHLVGSILYSIIKGIEGEKKVEDCLLQETIRCSMRAIDLSAKSGILTFLRKRLGRDKNGKNVGGVTVPEHFAPNELCALFAQMQLDTNARIVEQLEQLGKMSDLMEASSCITGNAGDSDEASI